MGLALDAARDRRLEVEPGGRDAMAAGLTNAVSALANALQRSLDLLAILVQQMDQDVVGLAVRQGLRQVGVLGDRRDHAADDVGKRPVRPRLFSAGVGQLHKRLAAGLQPLFRCTGGSFSNCPPQNPPFLSNTASSYVWIPFHNAEVVRATRSLTITGL